MLKLITLQVSGLDNSIRFTFYRIDSLNMLNNNQFDKL